MNIQFVIYENVVYVLEVNPRSSRTVPIISKVTGTPMIEWAIRVQLGEALKDLSSKLGLLPEPHYYAVKSPVFSSGKLKGVDPVLGPEMKSTGEILGLGVTLDEALRKALPFMQEQTNDEEYVLCSISDRAKEESLPTVKELASNQFKFAATKGTAEFLQKNGIMVEEIIKDSDQLNKLYRNQKIRAVINIPNEGRNDSKFGFYLREQSVKFNVPCYTHFDTVKAIIGLRKNKTLETNVNTVGEYFKVEKSKIGGAK